jgi:hypothetical protein
MRNRREADNALTPKLVQRKTQEENSTVEYVETAEEKNKLTSRCEVTADSGLISFPKKKTVTVLSFPSFGPLWTLQCIQRRNVSYKQQ